MVKSHKLQFERETSPMDCVALDVAFLDANTFGDKALRAEIINLFLAQLEAAQARLKLPTDEKSWAYLTHTMKGAAAAVGAQQLAALADAWGHRSQPASASARQALQDEIERAVIDFKAVSATLMT